MVFYRLKQFFLYLNVKITNDDLEYISLKLNTNELRLFRMLSLHEQKHSINVSKDVEIICLNKKINSCDLVKVALLHDIGKINVKLNIIEKSILVILNFLLRSKINRLTFLNKFNIYYNHPQIGADILHKYGYSERFLYLIKNHHNKNEGDYELNIIRICDDKN